MRWAAKVDANQAELVRVLRAAGARVQLLHAVGMGCPDLLIGIRGVNLLAEVKDGAKVPSARVLTPDQVVWHRNWRGQVDIVESPADALALLARIR